MLAFGDSAGREFKLCGNRFIPPEDPFESVRIQ